MKTTRRDFLCLSAMACAWLLTGCQNPTVEERAVSWQQQEVSDPVSETGPMWNAALDDNAVLRDGIRVPQNFELPLEGSTGFAGAAVMLLYERPDGASTVLRRLAAGDMFYIRQESGAYWQVCLLDGTVGWLENELCMINLPDVLPSIVYENPNAKASIFKTCGKDIEGITGQKLYDGLFYNQRLGRDEYLMPINYAMAKKVGAAQKNALKEGDCLKIIETFRPYEVQMLVKDAVYAKARMDKELMTALNKGAWNIGWFIATSLSNHQRGVAMDTTLLRITEQTEHSMAGCPFVQVTGEEYAMPSAMHELSSAAACFTEAGMQQIRETLGYYKQNAKVLSETLDSLGIWYTGGKNSPYLWLKCPNSMDSWTFFDYLLEHAHVVGTPGAGFGKNGDGFFRLTAFGDQQRTVEAAERLKKLLG